MALTPEQEAQMPSLAEAIETVRKISAKRRMDATDRETLAKLEKGIQDMVAASRRVPAERATEYDEREVEKDMTAGRKIGGAGAVKLFEHVTRSRNTDPNGKAIDRQLEQAQEHLDRCHMLSACLDDGRGPRPITELKYFWDGLKHIEYFRKTLEVSDVQQTLTATGWQPAEFTQRIIDKVRLARLVTAQHERFAMPADPYRFPVQGNDINIFKVPEQGAADADLSAGNRVPTGITQTGASNLVMSASKIGTRITLSAELEEDSFIPIIPWLEGQVVRGMTDTEENVTVNGDVAGTLDGGSWAATDPRLAWSGYRKFLATVTTAFVDNGGGLTIDIAKLRLVRQLMGKFAINPRDVFWLCGPAGYIKLLSLSDGTNPSPVLTLEKYGAAATILTGELARVDGIPVMVTEFMGPGGGEMLNAAGAYNGTTTTFTEMLLVRPEAMIYGDRRAARMERLRLPMTDQTVMVILQRLTFMNRRPNDPVVGGLYNIKKV